MTADAVGRKRGQASRALLLPLLQDSLNLGASAIYCWWLGRTR